MRAPLAVLALIVFCVGCASQQTSEPRTLDRLWRASGQAVALVPGTSDYAVGDVRLTFLVVTRRGRTVERPRARVWVARTRTAAPFARTIARLERVGVGDRIEAGDVRTIYVTHLRLRRPGLYWVLARPLGAATRIGGIDELDVKARPSSPAVGSRAYPSRTPTLATAPVRALTTRVPPDRALLRYSIAGALRAHLPFVVTFATPRFCTSRTCGPVVDVVDAVRRRLRGSAVRFIHVEIYRDNDPSKGENEWVRQWHLPTEPWTFVVGRDGRIHAKFEGSLSVPELRTAVRRVLSRAA